MRTSLDPNSNNTTEIMNVCSTTSTNSDTISNLKETDLLRQDSKTLLWSLKQHQNAIKQSFSKLIIQKEEEEEMHQTIEDTQVAEIEEEEELYDNVTTNNNNNYLIENDSYKLKFKKINKKSNSNSVSVKTVSFSDYLRTSCYQLDDEYNISNNNNNRSNQRRSRSVSPYLNNKKPVKSILKKQIVQDELSEDDNEVEDIVDDDENNNNNELITDTFSLNNQAASSSHSSSESLSSGRSVSTNSLLCSDIYGGFNSEYDINNNTQGDEEEHLGEEEEQTKQDHSTTINKSNKNKFIDFITKKRQAFLNHDYKQQFYEQDSTSIKYCPPTTPNNIDSKRHKTKQNRSYSADKSKNHYNKNQNYNNHQLIQQKKTKTTEPLPVAAAAAAVATNYKQTRLNNSLKKEKLRNYKKIVTQIKKSKPLLGYDWALDTIETKLNTTNTKFDKPETYWQELSQFRNQNKDECISNKQANFDASSLSNTTNFFNEIDVTNTDAAAAAAAVNDDADGRNHKCIHSYTLNERLFPVPIYKGKNGQSACPVCKSTRKEATTYCPQFFKISIPKSRIIQSYKIQPNKRSESNNNNNNNNKAPEDTLSLAEHCIAGYQNAPKKSSTIYNMPKSKTVDLKTASGITSDMSKMTIDDVKRIQQNRDPIMSGVYNKANAMRYELEDQHQKRLRELMPKLEMN